MRNEELNMTIEKQRCYLLHTNRSIIYVASLAGLYFDANFAYVIALTLWLWLPQCMMLELSVIRRLQHFFPLGRLKQCRQQIHQQTISRIRRDNGS